MIDSTAVNEESASGIMTVSKLRRALEEFDGNMLVFVKNEAGNYSTAITFNITEDDDLELEAL